jgi:hypothetical protein
MFIGVFCVPVLVFVYWGLEVLVYLDLTLFDGFIYGICGGRGM